jgi:hypothetical protein
MTTLTVTLPKEQVTTETCEAEAACTKPQALLRGDLLVCTEHARTMSGRVGNDVLCSCGYYRPVGTSCGEPCL